MQTKRILIYINGKERSSDVSSIGEHSDHYKIVFKGEKTEYRYNKSKVRVKKTALTTERAYKVFNYLYEIAKLVGLKTEDGKNILAKRFERITNISENSILSYYLNQSLPTSDDESADFTIFPFRFNLSQKDALNSAFSNTLSVIEGPPGTGKTQTILNIIANAVASNQTVAVVSSNNSATKNVYEKLVNSGLEFMVAQLGSAENKNDFINNQSVVPDFSEFALSKKQKNEKLKKANLLFTQLSKNLETKNELALLRQDLDGIKTEYQNFLKNYNSEFNNSNVFSRKINADAFLELWTEYELMAKKGKTKVGFFKRIKFLFKYGIKYRSVNDRSFSEMVLLLQNKYYATRISEWEESEDALELLISKINFPQRMDEYTTLSMHLLKGELFRKFNKQKRKKYSEEDLRSDSSIFLADYPVVLSTTYSLRSSLAENIIYDYVIIDEASQVDIVTGALALSCAKKAIIVGDLKQLPHVVNNKTKIQTDNFFEKQSLNEAFRYSTQSILSSITYLFSGVPKTLLKEHYRCHRKIIDFCNKRFYNNQLIIHSELTTERQPLIVYQTAPGNHARDRMNHRQIDVIQKEIIPKENLAEVDLGIVTPYRNQTNALQSAFMGVKFKADTVDKFQGRENDVIILSTVDNEITEFADDANRLNVAISRAKEQLILVVNSEEKDRDSNVADLIKYIEYNNYSIVESELTSIFDYLYRGLEKKRAMIIRKYGKVSDYDSENLMLILIRRILAEPRFSKYGVAMHYSLRNLIRDYSKLDPFEYKYAINPWTHLDFLIFNNVSRRPVMAIEVDGYSFHKKKSVQASRDLMKDSILEKYGFKLLRFATTGSNEKQKIISALDELS